MIKILYSVLVVYLVIVAAIFLGQRFLQYAPHTQAPGTPAAAGLPEMAELHTTTKDGLELLAWFSPPENRDGPIIVFFHGNAGDISGRTEKVRPYLDRGFGVYLCEYRGFGGNPGLIHEKGLYADARAGLEWLKANGYEPKQWVIYGESIGSGAAVEMAREYGGKALVLDGGFSSAGDVAQGRYFWLPAKWMLHDRYNNIDKISEIKMPLLMIHGDQDSVVPLKYGQKLFAAANEPKKMVIIEGGHHSDLYDFGAGKIVIDWLGGGHDAN